MRLGLTLAGGGGALAIVLLALAPHAAPAQQRPPVAAASGTAETPALPVEVAPVVVRPMADRIATFGNLLPYRTAAIAPQATGQVTRLLFEDGATVDEGQPLVEFDRRAAEAQVAAARTRADSDRTAQTRSETLARQGLAAQQSMEQAQSQAAASLASLRSAEAQLDLLTLRAPFRGTLGARQVDVGAVVAPGNRIVTIEDRSRLIVEFRVRGDAWTYVKPGLRFTLDPPHPGAEGIAGQVTFVDSAIDATTRTMLLRGVVDNTTLGLPAGLFVGVWLEIAVRPQALAVPAAAVARDLAGAYVYVVGADGRAKRRAIATGSRDAEMIEVRSGLAAGERVVTAGAFRLRDGDRVTAGDPPAPAAGRS